MVGQTSLFGLEDHSLLARGHPIEQLLEADDIVVFQVMVRKVLETTFLVVSPVRVHDRPHE